MIQRSVMKMEISVYSKAVYSLLMSYAGEKECCYPSIRTIAKDLLIAKNTVIKAINELVSVGLLEVEKVSGKNGENLNNNYYPMYVIDEPSGGSQDDQRGSSYEQGVGHGGVHKNNIKKNNIKGEDVDSDKSSSFAHTQCVDFWLKEFHIGWNFNGIQGKSLKSLLTQIKKILVSHGRLAGDQEIIDFFKQMCLTLPAWYKDKDLMVINSKFNEIITEISNGKQKQRASYGGDSKYRN